MRTQIKAEFLDDDEPTEACLTASVSVPEHLYLTVSNESGASVCITLSKAGVADFVETLSVMRSLMED